MRPRPQPLLVTLRGIIERTFDLDTGVGDLSRYIIGDRGLARIYGREEIVRTVKSARRRFPAGAGDDRARAPGPAGMAGAREPGGRSRPDPPRRTFTEGARPAAEALLADDGPIGEPPGPGTGRSPLVAGSTAAPAPDGGAQGSTGARTLLREDRGDVRVMLYYPDRLISNLERHHPGRSLSHRNVDDFAVLVEELDHFLTIADRHRAGAQMSLLELELHANVTKELVLRLFLARAGGRRRLRREEREWIRHHLFHKVEYREEEPGVQARYRDAAALAVRYLDALHDLPAAERPRELRRFHRRTHHEKLGFIARL